MMQLFYSPVDQVTLRVKKHTNTSVSMLSFNLFIIRDQLYLVSKQNKVNSPTHPKEHIRPTVFFQTVLL